MTVHVDGHYHISAPRPFNIVKVLHLPVVVPSVTGDNSGRGVILTRIGRNEQQGAHQVAGSSLPTKVLDLHPSTGCLNNGSSDCAHQHEYQSDSQPFPGQFFRISHCILLLTWSDISDKTTMADEIIRPLSKPVKYFPK
ncbi:hypothetical protein L21SP2_2010 [Salinispira pacifica]|uniref:Uncharacterized protein n=1 Tax=Salinispira pacifica TaxID=1307761 RepID=V5WJN4_9SPIO|nr:hypothetical protein L21SP2_2010 [Salinispira pacifica]